MRTQQPALRRLAATVSGAILGRRVILIAAALVLVPLSATGQVPEPIHVMPAPGDVVVLDVPGLGPVSNYVLAHTLNGRKMRLENVDYYVERIAGGEIPGLEAFSSDGPQQGPRCTSNCVVYKVETVENPDGTPGRQARLLSALEVQTLAGMSPGSDLLQIYGATMLTAQSALNTAVGGEDMLSVLSGIANRDWDQRINDTDIDNGPFASFELEFRKPWLNPFRTLAAGGLMVIGTGAAVRDAENSLATSAIQAQAEANEVAEVVAQLEEVGVEELEGGPATRFSLAGVNALMDTVDGQEVFFNGTSIWLDNDEFVIAAHRIDGTMVADGASRPFFLEVRNSDFRQVPGCDLYEPYRRVTRMGGLLDDAQMAQMEEARQQLEEFDRKMASMPASQRSMMEKMMGGQMDTLRNMANGGTLEYVQEIEEILCNPDLKALFSVAPGGPVALGVDLADIQKRLVTLGYEPGNTDGVLDTLTQIAISQFEAEHGMAVTGEPSFQLATALAAAVAE
jgi:hypothetical protein